MDDDTDLALSTIHDGNAAALVEQMMEIQKHTISRSDAAPWLGRLRFLDISALDCEGMGPGGGRHRDTLSGISLCSGGFPVRTLPLRINKRGHYVAVSWRWSNDMLDSGTSRYYIRRPGKAPHCSEVSNLIFDRSIRFAQAHNIRFLWIDKECIYQEDKRDKSTWIQVMDLVYRGGGLSLDLLSVVIQSQLQLDSLSKLLREDVFYRSQEKVGFKSRVSDGLVSGIADVLRLILSDERWERTWIFQEDHCASARMHLLIRHDCSLQKDHYLFGDIQGELQIPCHSLRKAVTRFCLACKADDRGNMGDMHTKVRQYNIWNKDDGTGTDPSLGDSQGSAYNAELPRLPASSLSILCDIRQRHNEKVEDRLAIFANCCQYLTRLDTEYLTENRCGLSTSILCLYLLNGELFRMAEQDSRAMLNCSIHVLLERICFKFDPPVDIFRASYIDNYCRIPKVDLTPEGVQTVGWLWEVGNAITFIKREEERITLLGSKSPSSSNGYSELSLLRERLRKLRHHWLASKLPKYPTPHVHTDRRTAKSFVNDMCAAVIDGLLQGKPLRLARLHGNHEVRAIFVMGLSDIVTATTVFTSFLAKDQKLVSIEVQHGGAFADGRERLYAQSWVNGVWFSAGMPKKTCVFPWPW